MADFWGQDIALDNFGQAKIAANGELVLTDGVETGLQDIQLRLYTRLGSLFYDKNFGTLIHDWILEDSTAVSRAAFCSEVVMRVELDARVRLGSVSCIILKWDEKSIAARLSFAFIGEDTPLNLVFSVSRDNTAVLDDVNPTDDAGKNFIGA